jgi:hypothetical protein
MYVKGKLGLLGVGGRGLYHTTSNGIERIRSETRAGSDDPSEQEGGKEVTLEGSNENNRLEGIVHTEIETSVDDDTSDGGTETTVQTTDTIGSKRLPVDINQTVELTFTAWPPLAHDSIKKRNLVAMVEEEVFFRGDTFLCGLCVVGQSSTGVIQRVDKHKRACTSSSTRSQVTSKPHPVTISFLLKSKHSLEVIFHQTPKRTVGGWLPLKAKFKACVGK